ncbi:MAG: hypothetical protein ACLQEQ_03635 [Nitrososphaerales archaeon]
MNAIGIFGAILDIRLLVVVVPNLLPLDWVAYAYAFLTIASLLAVPYAVIRLRPFPNMTWGLAAFVFASPFIEVVALNLSKAV